MTKKVIGVLVSGRGSNLQAIIENVEKEKLPVKIGVVISDRADALALKKASDAGIETAFVNRKDYSTKEEFEEMISKTLLKYNVSLVVLAGFMRIFSSSFIREWPHKVMNIHPSLLPSFPGLEPQAQAIRYGVKVSGCTVHFVDEGMDTGPIILQAVVHVDGKDTDDTLSKKILAEEHKLYSEAIKLWAEDKLHIDGRLVTIT